MTMTLIAICLTIPNWVAERQYKTKIKTEIKTCNFLRGVSFLFFLRLHLSFVFYSSKCVVCIQNSCTIYQRVGITNNMILTKYLTNCDTNKFLHCFFPISFAFSFILSRIWKETQFIVLSSLARALSLSFPLFLFLYDLHLFPTLLLLCIMSTFIWDLCFGGVRVKICGGAALGCCTVQIQNFDSWTIFAMLYLYNSSDSPIHPIIELESEQENFFSMCDFVSICLRSLPGNRRIFVHFVL